MLVRDNEDIGNEGKSGVIGDDAREADLDGARGAVDGGHDAAVEAQAEGVGEHRLQHLGRVVLAAAPLR